MACTEKLDTLGGLVHGPGRVTLGAAGPLFYRENRANGSLSGDSQARQNVLGSGWLSTVCWMGAVHFPAMEIPARRAWRVFSEGVPDGQFGIPDTSSSRPEVRGEAGACPPV